MSTSDKKSLNISVTELEADSASDLPLATPGTPHQLKQWPAAPMPLKAEPVIERFMDVFDVVICLIPLALIAKTILILAAWKLDSGHKGDYIDKVSFLSLHLIRFNSQLTTLFTVVFILLMTMLVRRLALWRAERGATVAELELLQSSISLPSTLRVMTVLRLFTWTSAALVVTWCWYYLGSQATTREYSYQLSDPKTKIQVAYLSSSAPSPFQDGSFDRISAVRRTDMTSKFHIYSSASNAKTGSDVDGAALTPLYADWADEANNIVDGAHNITEELEYEAFSDASTEVHFDRHGWQDVSIASTNQYTSSIGTHLYYRLPHSIWGAHNNTGDEGQEYYTDIKLLGDYQYNTTYLVANCTQPALVNEGKLPGLLPTITMSLNMTAKNATAHDKPRTFEVWGRVAKNTSVRATCSISEAVVEIQARCDTGGCKARKMRPTPGKPLLSNRTPFDDDAFAHLFFNELLLACGVPQSPDDRTVAEEAGGWAPFVSDLSDDMAEPMPDRQEDMEQDLETDITPQDLSLGLTKLFNTWHAASQFLPYQHNFADGMENGEIYLPTMYFSKGFARMDMKGAPYFPQYRVSWPWIVLDLIACKILLIAAVAAFWLRKHTLAPDVLGYVSSLTRDNPHVQLPDGGTTLSGLDRARALKHVRVKIADIGGSERQIGKVGLCYTGNDEVRLQELKREGLYV